MGAVTTIARDLFGNMTQLTQGGTQNGYTASVTRQFWYDARCGSAGAARRSSARTTRRLFIRLGRYCKNPSTNDA